MAAIQLFLGVVFVAIVKIMSHDEEHLQPISGDCSKLAPLGSVAPKSLHGREWIVMYDSYLEDPKESCVTFSARLDGNILHTTENVQTSTGTVRNVNVKFQIDEKRPGYYIDEHGGIAVVLTADQSVNGLCFAECTKLEHGGNYGAHVFCGTTTGRLIGVQRRLFNNALREVERMGIDLKVQKIPTKCP